MFKQFQSGKTEAPSNVLTLEPKHAEAPAKFDAAEAVRDEKLSERLELKSRLHDALLERLNLSVLDKVEPDELRRQVAAMVSTVLAEDKRPMKGDEFQEIIGELLHEILGLGPLEPLLEDPTVNDILVNNHKSVYVERFGVLEKSPVRFRDERHLLRIIDKIVSRIGRRVDESQPWVDARLEDGSRVNAIIRPCAIDGPSISIRKFSKTPLDFRKLVSYGSLSQDACDLLEGMVRARLNILISGGTGSGKTTMLNALSSNIDGRERIVTIEDAAELQLQQGHVVRLETRPAGPSGNGAIIQRDLVRNALRMRPDRIVVGEVRGSEAFDMLQAMNTGHDGSMTTVHANTARDALARLEQMVLISTGDFPLSAIRGQLASAIHVIVQLSRLADGKRRVMSISEIVGMEGEVITMQDLFVFRKSGRGEDGEIKGEFVPTGIRPKCAETLIAAGIEVKNAALMGRGE